MNKDKEPPKEERPLDPMQVDFVALSNRTTRAQAAYLLRAGYALLPGWEQQLERLYAAEQGENDYTVNEEAAKKKAQK